MRQRVAGQRVAVRDRRRDGIAAGVLDRGHPGDRQRALRGDDALPGERAAAVDGLAADHDACDPVDPRGGERPRLGQRTRVGGRAIGQVGLEHGLLAAFGIEPAQRHPVVGTLDRDRQRARAGIAVAVLERIRKRLGQRLGFVEPLDQRVGVIERVDIPAACQQRQRAIGPRQRRAHAADVCAEAHRRYHRAIRALRILGAVGRVEVGPADTRDHIAIRDQRAILGHAVDIGGGGGDVVDDSDGQRGGGGIVVLVCDYDGERVRGGIARGVGGQLVSVANRTAGNAGDRQRAERAADDLADGGHGHAADGHRCRAVGRGEGEVAAGELAVGRRSRARGQPRLEHLGRARGARGRNGQRGGAVGDRDDEVGAGQIAVAIAHGIGEAVADPARSSGVADVAVGAGGRDRQRAILALDRDPGQRGGLAAGIREHDDTVGSGGIVGGDAARDRAIGARRNRTRIVARSGHIVGDGDHQRRARLVAVAVGHDDREGIAGRIGQGVVGQCVAVAVRAVGDRNGEHACGGGHGAATGDVNPVDHKTGEGVAAGADRDRPDSGLVGAGGIGTGGLFAARRQGGFADGVIARYADRRDRIRQQRDRHRRAAGVAVAIGDRVIERDRPLLARAGGVGEGAIGVIHQRAGAAERAGNRSDCGERNAVCTLDIVGQNVDRDRGVFGGLRHAVGDRVGNVVGNRNGEAARRSIAIDVGHNQVEGNAGGVARGVVGQGEAIADRARDGVEGGDGQSPAGGGDDRANGHGDAVDRRGDRGVAAGEGDCTAGRFSRRRRVRARRFAGARREPGFGDDGPGAASRRQRSHHRNRIGNGQGQRGGRDRAVGVGQRVGERIADPARGSRAPRVGIAAVGLDRQRAILPGYLEVARAIEAGVGVGRDGVAGDPGDACVVRAQRIGTRGTASGAHAGDDVAGLRGEG